MTVIQKGSKENPFELDPDSRLDFGFDYSDVLLSDSIIDYQLTSELQTSGDHIVSDNPRRVVFFVSGGVIGTIATVQCRITSQSGRVLDKTAYFFIEQR